MGIISISCTYRIPFLPESYFPYTEVLSFPEPFLCFPYSYPPQRSPARFYWSPMVPNARFVSHSLRPPVSLKRLRIPLCSLTSGVGTRRANTGVSEIKNIFLMLAGREQSSRGLRTLIIKKLIMGFQSCTYLRTLCQVSPRKRIIKCVTFRLHAGTYAEPGPSGNV